MTPWLLAATALGLALASSLAIERAAATPGAPGPRAGAFPARALVIGALFLLWLGLFRRPLLAGFAVVVTVAAVTAVSVRKRQLVAEPLVFSDFALLRLVVRHPDLYYLGFMNDPRFVAAVLAFVGALATWIWLEPALLPIGAGLALSLAVLATIAGLWGLAARGPIAPRLRAVAARPDLENHVGRWGLLLTLAVYALRWRAEIAQPFPPLPDDADGAGARPDLVVVVQLESFIDPVRLRLSNTPLPALASARERAVVHGPLDVPAHGAFTMRSEFAVLTGLEPSDSGFRQYDPYLSSRGTVPSTLATRLGATGYRTVFMHPFRAGFFNRAEVMPRLGFGEFRWDDDFAGAERVGPYMSDVALAGCVLAEARAARGSPVLIMAVTMENHGPWPAGRLPDEPDATRQYLRHLAGSDRAITALIEGLEGHEGHALLCLYGDHPPILPGIDRALPPQTDYVVLELGRAAPRRDPVRARLTVGGLGRLVLTMATGGEPSAALAGPRPAA